MFKIGAKTVRNLRIRLRKLLNVNDQFLQVLFHNNQNILKSYFNPCKIQFHLRQHKKNPPLLVS